MDGLTLSTSEQLLKSGKTTSQIRLDKTRDQSGISADLKSFSETLKESFNEVNQMQKIADVKIQKLATGEAKNIPEVMIAVEKADVALKLMTKVRNKIIDAYQEIMKMQV